MKLYSKSYWVCTVIDFIGYLPLFTILLFYVFEVGKAKSKSQSVLMILTLNSVFLTLSLPRPFFFFHYSVCTIISDCSHPFDTSTFTHTVSQEYIIAIENTYLNGDFLKSKIKRNFNPKVINYF